MKRIVQYSVDILIRDEEENSLDFAEIIAEALETRGFYVCGAGFNDDVTEAYNDYCIDTEGK